jgi:hypothetical protein
MEKWNNKGHFKEEVLGKPNNVLCFDMTRTAEKTSQNIFLLVMYMLPW